VAGQSPNWDWVDDMAVERDEKKREEEEERGRRREARASLVKRGCVVGGEFY